MKIRILSFTAALAFAAGLVAAPSSRCGDCHGAAAEIAMASTMACCTPSCGLAAAGSPQRQLLATALSTTSLVEPNALAAAPAPAAEVPIAGQTVFAPGQGPAPPSAFLLHLQLRI